jgi:hypothetical protein
MKLRTLFCAAVVCPLVVVASHGQSRPVSITSASDIPHLRKQGTATQLIVDGKPFLALGAELIEGDCLELKWPRKGAPQSRMSTENIQRFTLYRYR